MGWLSAIDGYEVSLVNGVVACRTSAGKPLKTVPKAVKESDAVASLRQVQEWLARHTAQCLQTIEDWLLRSLPVPTTVLGAVWPDEAWRTLLTDLVLAPVDASGAWLLDGGGFLRDAEPGGRLGVVTLDGETVRLAAQTVVLPHPVLLADLEDLRGFATDLTMRQGVAQLFREIWRKPAGEKECRSALGQYAGGHFTQLRQLTGRAIALGYTVRGGCATLRLWEAGRALDARVWLGDGDPSTEAETGDLVFVDRGGVAVPVEDVGPVAWSEGLRMAAALYAGRAVPAETGS